MLFYIIFNSGLSTNKKIAHKRSSTKPDSNNSFSDVVKSPTVKIALYISIKSISLPFSKIYTDQLTKIQKVHYSFAGNQE